MAALHPSGLAPVPRDHHSALQAHSNQGRNRGEVMVGAGGRGLSQVREVLPEVGP